MHALTREEAEQWCGAHGIALDARRLPRPSFAEIQGLDFAIPADAGRRIALLHQLFGSFPPEQEVLVWFDDWGVWPSGERKHMFERFRDSYGEHRWLSEAPAYVFAPAEREDAISFAGFAILFLWDCHVLTDAAHLVVFLPRRGWMALFSLTAAVACRVKA